MILYRLEPGVQHYAWGDTRFIPDLLGLENLEQRPYAELWLGTHRDLPSHVEIDGERRLLSDVLGVELPYLLKILTAQKPLSIQAHPSEERARQGFALENAAGVPIDAPHRVYRDPHHKPELLCALTDFYALRGFRLDPPSFASAPTLKESYETLMTLPQDEVDALLEPMVSELDTEAFGKQDREYWVLRCHHEFSEAGHYDRGLFSVYLLNLIHLRPGEAIYLDAGVLHAYLEGAGVEIMANSNNVLRGGLTKKHVDIPELLKTVVFAGEAPQVLRAAARSESEWVYPTPAREFELCRIESPHDNGPDHGPEILIVTEGEATIGPHHIRRGESICIPEGQSYAIDGSATLYKAAALLAG
jgi:mannose-6-phosphate isomerase class I